MTDLLPGKGFNGDATEESILFTQNALYDIITVFQGEYGPDKVSGDAWADEGHAKDLVNELLKLDGWEKEVDSFGYKAFKLLEWGEGAYRVTFILMKRGDLKVDIRQWYAPK